MQKITTHLWFDDQAEEAANFYVSLFKNSKVGNISHYGEASADVSGQPAGSVMTVSFELDGQEFLALNGGPLFKFNEAISLVVTCEDQAEVDELWAKFTEEGEESKCGWLKDKYGLSWQIVPKGLGDIFSGDSEGAQRAMQALLGMNKIELDVLKQAYKGSD